MSNVRLDFSMLHAMHARTRLSRCLPPRLRESMWSHESEGPAQYAHGSWPMYASSAFTGSKPSPFATLGSLGFRRDFRVLEQVFSRNSGDRGRTSGPSRSLAGTTRQILGRVKASRRLARASNSS